MGSAEQIHKWPFITGRGGNERALCATLTFQGCHQERPCLPTFLPVYLSVTQP